MRRSFLLVVTLILTTACSRDPKTLYRQSMESADRYLEKSRPREASIMYRRALKYDSRSGIAYYRLAQIDIKQNEYLRAAVQLRRAVELLPPGKDRTVAMTHLGEICAVFLDSVQRSPEILQELARLSEELLREDPQSFDGHRFRGRWAGAKAADLWIRSQRGAAAELRGQAIADFRAADQIRAWRPEVIVPLARCLVDDGKRQEAERLLLGMVDRQKTAVTAYADLARLYAADRRIADLDSILKRAELDNPHFHAFSSDRAVLYYKLGRQQDALGVLDQLQRRAKDSPNAYVAAGTIYLRTGRPGEAIRQYEQAIRELPAQKQIFQKLIVEAYIAQGNTKEAERSNEALLREFPGDIDAQVRRASLRMERGELSQALADLGQLRQKAPDNANVIYELGRALERNGQPEMARMQYTVALQLSPRFLPARLALGRIQLQSDEYGLALATAEGILAAESDNQQGFLMTAAAYRGMKKYDEARAIVKRVLAASPNSPEALMELGAVEEADGHRREAEAAYRASYAANPRDLRPLKALVAFQLRAGEGKAALQTLERESANAPERTDLRSEYADIANKTGDYKTALREYERLLVELKNLPTAVGGLHLRIGEIRRRQGDPAKAMEHLSIARALLPESPLVLHELAIVYETLGKRKEASEFYEASLKANGDNGIALNNLACYLVENGGDLDRALTLAQRARQQIPTQPAITDTIGWIYYKKNLNDNALEIFEKLVKDNPKQPSFRYHLGAALLRKGEKARARRELEQALAHLPSAQEASQIRELLSQGGG